MGDWDDVFGNENCEWCGTEDEEPKYVAIDDSEYQRILESALSNSPDYVTYDLITKNHVFTTFAEAAFAARKKMVGNGIL